MMALSVIWISSGQTSVQHFVMLHSPMPSSSFSSFVRKHRPSDAFPIPPRAQKISARQTARTYRDLATHGKHSGKENTQCTCEIPVPDPHLPDKTSNPHRPSV